MGLVVEVGAVVETTAQATARMEARLACMAQAALAEGQALQTATLL
jgi:hypothetical protein